MRSNSDVPVENLRALARAEFIHPHDMSPEARAKRAEVDLAMDQEISDIIRSVRQSESLDGEDLHQQVGGKNRVFGIGFSEDR